MPMMNILQLNGTDPQLYQLAAPLVMDPKVLKQNQNYPFRTSDSHQWFMAIDGQEVAGFMPVDIKRQQAKINNYYVKDNNADVLDALLKKTIEALSADCLLTSITQVKDIDTFKNNQFNIAHEWKKFVKMVWEG